MYVHVHHVRKVSLGIKRKYRVFDDDGSGRPGTVSGYAEKRLTAADAFDMYRDETREQRTATIIESTDGFLASLTGYEVHDTAGELRCTFSVMVRRSLERTRWTFDHPIRGQLLGTERSITTARTRRVAGLLGSTAGQVVNSVIKYHFDFTSPDGDVVLSMEKPKVLDDWYRLVLHDDTVDPLLAAALAIVMEARSR